MNWRGRLLMVALAVLAAWSVWWLRQLDTGAPKDRNAPPHRIDYSMEKFDLTVLDPAGKPQYRLQADTMQHYADDDSSEFVHPHVAYTAPDATPWRLSAERGWMAARGTEIRLLGAVRVEGRTPQPMTLVTRDIVVIPDENTASTLAPVTLTGTGVRITAVGMRAWFDQKRVQLLSQVKGHYDATAR